MKTLTKVSLLASPYLQMHVQQTYVVIQHLFCSYAELLRNNRLRYILIEYATVSKEREVGGITYFTKYLQDRQHFIEILPRDKSEWIFFCYLKFSFDACLFLWRTQYTIYCVLKS